MDLKDEIFAALQTAGFTEDEMVRLIDPIFLRDIERVLDGMKEIIDVGSWIITDKEPFVPPLLNNYKLHDRTLGNWLWDHTRLQLYRSKPQIDGGQVWGNRLMRWIKKRRKFNACVLDYLHRRPKRLPPSSWEWLRGNDHRTIFFPGTTYTNKQVYPCLRGLTLNQDGKLVPCHHRLDAKFGPDDAFALVAE